MLKKIVQLFFKNERNIFQKLCNYYEIIETLFFENRTIIIQKIEEIIKQVDYCSSKNAQ